MSEDFTKLTENHNKLPLPSFIWTQKIFCGLALRSTMDEAKWCFGPIHPLHLPHRFYYNSVMEMWERLKIRVSSLSSLVMVVFLNLTLDFLTVILWQDFPPPCWGQVPSTESWILNCLNTACRTFWTVIIPVVACKLPENTSPQQHQPDTFFYEVWSRFAIVTWQHPCRV